MWIRHNWSNVTTVFCLILVATIEAWNQMIRDAEDFRKILPDFAVSPMLNYIPLILLIIAGLVWLMGRFPQTAKNDDRLSIDYAGYGLDFGEYYNATDKLAKFVENGGLSVRVSNAILGFDPYPNEEKQLLVIYSHRENRGLQIIVKERERLKLP